MKYTVKEFQDREYTFRDAIKDKAIHSTIAKLVLVFTFIACVTVVFSNSTLTAGSIQSLIDTTLENWV